MRATCLRHVAACWHMDMYAAALQGRIHLEKADEIVHHTLRAVYKTEKLNGAQVSSQLVLFTASCNLSRYLDTRSNSCKASLWCRTPSLYSDHIIKAQAHWLKAPTVRWPRQIKTLEEKLSCEAKQAQHTFFLGHSANSPQANPKVCRNPLRFACCQGVRRDLRHGNIPSQ